MFCRCRFCAMLAGAVVIAVVVAGGAYGLGSLAVKPQGLEKSVYVVEAPAPIVSATKSATAEPVAEAAKVPLPELLAKGDKAAGEKYAKVCAACHSFGKGEAAKIGPNLYGVVGEKHARMAGFTYSEGMKAQADKLWSFEELNAFLTNPRGQVPGTKMTFAGIKGDGDRANVLLWLRSLADNPVSLSGK